MSTPIQLLAFSGVTGTPKKVLKYSSLSWSDSINSDGSLDATVLGSSVDNYRDILPYGTILAAVQGERIFHAGYVKHHSYSAQNDSYGITCGGCLAVLEKRLVINRALSYSSWNKVVTIDEDNPPGEWILHAKGSYADLIAALIKETIAQAGPLPIRVAGSEGGDHERNWKCWELATVAQRIQDIGDLENGDEYRFDPHIEDGNLYFQQRTAPEIADNYWQFVADAQGSQVELSDRDVDGDRLCYECYATGGRDEDRLLTALIYGREISEDCPALQIADTSHSSVSELGTLQGYASAIVALGSRLPETTGIKVPRSTKCLIGDNVDIGYHNKTYRYRITDISGSADSEMLELSLAERYE